MLGVAFVVLDLQNPLFQFLFDRISFMIELFDFLLAFCSKTDEHQLVLASDFNLAKKVLDSLVFVLILFLLGASLVRVLTRECC